jgi:hypothetical protein
MKLTVPKDTAVFIRQGLKQGKLVKKTFVLNTWSPAPELGKHWITWCAWGKEFAAEILVAEEKFEGLVFDTRKHLQGICSFLFVPTMTNPAMKLLMNL